MNLLDIDKCFFLVYASDNDVLLVIDVERDINFW